MQVLLATDYHCFSDAQYLVIITPDNTAGLRHCRLNLASAAHIFTVSVLCFSELAASQHFAVATTAFAVIARPLCGTSDETTAAQVVLQACCDALVDVVDSPCGLSALMAAEKLQPHAPGAVAAALACFVDLPDDAGAMQWWSALAPVPEHYNG